MVYIYYTHTQHTRTHTYVYKYKSKREEYMVSSYRVKLVKVIANTNKHIQTTKCVQILFFSFFHLFRSFVLSRNIARKEQQRRLATGNDFFPTFRCCILYNAVGFHRRHYHQPYERSVYSPIS